MQPSAPIIDYAAEKELIDGAMRDHQKISKILQAKRV